MNRKAVAWLACVLLAGCNAGPDQLLERAQKNLRAGDFRAASIDLKTLLQKEPNSAKSKNE